MEHNALKYFVYTSKLFLLRTTKYIIIISDLEIENTEMHVGIKGIIKGYRFSTLWDTYSVPGHYFLLYCLHEGMVSEFIFPKSVIL